MGYVLVYSIDLAHKVPGRNAITVMHCLARLKILSGQWCQRYTLPLLTSPSNDQHYFINSGFLIILTEMISSQNVFVLQRLLDRSFRSF